MKILNFMGRKILLNYSLPKLLRIPPTRIEQNFSKKLMKNNKKGMLLASETLKIILAVICIGFLVYLLSAIYFNSGDTKKLEQAGTTMDRINSILERFDEANFSGEAITEISPVGWKIFAFVEDEAKPNSCSEENCLCICENVVADYFDRQVKKCDDLGVCAIVPNLMEFEDIKIGKASDPTSLFIGKKGIWVEVTEI
jgi:hypothetical protein